MASDPSRKRLGCPEHFEAQRSHTIILDVSWSARFRGGKCKVGTPPGIRIHSEAAMRKIIGCIGGCIGVAMIITVVIAAFIAYFVYKTDPTTNVIYDGFGRPLSESPFLMRWFLGQDRVWAGWVWFALDMVIFWGGALTGYGLACWGFKETQTESSSNAV